MTTQLKNQDIRMALQKSKVKYWELAERYGISQSTLSVKLRKELPEDEKLKLFSLIQEIAKEKEANV